MKLQQLTLQSFRCFAQETITFDERLTVFVGKNGSGKTAILNAIAVFLANIVEGYTNTKPYNSFSLNVDNDRTLFSTKNMELHLELSYKNKKILLNESNEDRKFVMIHDPKTGLINQIEQNIFTLTQEECHHPLAYYTPSRLAMQAEKTPERADVQDMAAAYTFCLAPWLSLGATMDWIDRHDAHEARQLRSGNNNFRDPELSAMREAVEKTLPEFGNLSFDSLKNEITLQRKKDGQTFSFWQLSDGYRAMLALILDLSRRMALINGKQYTQEGHSILESPAIVLIDEVELHLHPGWQQTVLPSLLEIFPNTQFIVTTHSPQVLSSIEPHNIRLLEGGRCIPYEGSTYGAESSRILEEVFGISLRAKTDAKTALDAYLKLVQNGDYGSQQALKLRQKLDAWLYGDPILDSADMLIRRAERQKAREADRA